MISNERFIKEINDEILTETGIHDAYQKYCGQLMLEDIFTTDAVYISACHCALGFRRRKDTQRFMLSPWQNSRKLVKEVLDGKFKPEYYGSEKITERGKPRVIRPPKFECKVIQKTLCDYLLRTLLEPKMITESYASIRGRGTEKLYGDILRGLNRYGRPGSIIVINDFKGFFASIDHDILEYSIDRYLTDNRLTKLFMKFCEHDEGLSLGNEASQIPASCFPSPLDHEIKDRLGERGFYRYMDDTLCIAENTEQARLIADTEKKMADRLKLSLKHPEAEFIPWGHSFVFCKERFVFNKRRNHYYRLMNPKTVSTEIRKLKRFKVKVDNGEMTMDAVNAQYRGVTGMIKGRPDTYKAIQKIKDTYQTLFEKEETTGNE